MDLYIVITGFVEILPSFTACLRSFVGFTCVVGLNLGFTGLYLVFTGVFNQI